MDSGTVKVINDFIVKVFLKFTQFHYIFKALVLKRDLGSIELSP